MKQSLTLMICTHNRADLLEVMLNSISGANRSPGRDVRTLVVANACTDETHSLLEKRKASDSHFSWAKEPNLGKSEALNTGISLLETEWVVMLDDDQRLDKGFVEAVTKSIAEYPGVGMFCGRLVPDWDGSEPQWVHESGRYRIYPPPITQFDAGPVAIPLTEGDPTPGGGNLIMRTALLRNLGGFSPDKGPRGHNYVGGEDSDLMLKAMKQGERFLYIPEILQYHYVDKARLKLTSLMRLSYQRSRADALVKSSYGGRIPLFLLKKLTSYLLSLLFSGGGAKSYFFLMRLAATLGEARGILEQRQS